MNAEMKRREAPHGKAHDMSPLDLELIQHIARVVDRAPLRVHLDRFRHIRRRISARIESNAAIPACKVAHLQFPAPVITRELVNEEDGTPGATVFIE